MKILVAVLGLLALAELAVLTAGCQSITAPTQIPLNYVYQSQAAFAIAQVQIEADENKPEEEKTDECPQCYGTGKTGDGIATCTACGGSGERTTRIERKNQDYGLNLMSPNDLTEKLEQEKVAGAKPTDEELAEFEKLKREINDELQRRLDEQKPFWSRDEVPKKQKLTIRYGSNCQPCREAEAAIKADGPLRGYIAEHFIIERVPAKPGQNVPAFFVGDEEETGFKTATNLLAWLKSVQL